MGAQWKAKPREAAANARGKIFGRLVKEIMIAARNGAEPDLNPKLRLAIHQAKKASMPKETLDRAIANLGRRKILPDVGRRGFLDPCSVEAHSPEHAGRADTALAPMPIETHVTRILPAGSCIMP